MVRARLHLICGNCGSADQWEHKVEIEPDEEDLTPQYAVYIACNNCNTLHSLEDNSKCLNNKEDE